MTTLREMMFTSALRFSDSPDKTTEITIRQADVEGIESEIRADEAAKSKAEVERLREKVKAADALRDAAKKLIGISTNNAAMSGTRERWFVRKDVFDYAVADYDAAAPTPEPDNFQIRVTGGVAEILNEQGQIIGRVERIGDTFPSAPTDDEPINEFAVQRRLDDHERRFDEVFERLNGIDGMIAEIVVKFGGRLEALEAAPARPVVTVSDEMVDAGRAFWEKTFEEVISTRHMWNLLEAALAASGESAK